MHTTCLFQEAHGKLDARDSAIEKLVYQLHMEQKKLKDYEELVPKLEERLCSNKEHLSTTRYTLKEKTATLLQTRKQLKIAREKNMVHICGTKFYGAHIIPSIHRNYHGLNILVLPFFQIYY